MDNLFEGGIAELEEIKAALVEETKFSMNLDAAKDNLKLKQKQIAEENEAIEDKIQEILKSRRDAVTEPLNQEIAQAEEILKESMKRRDMAKEVAVNKRINLETAGIHDQNVQLEFSVKTLMKNANMPTFCGKPYYYALYAPKGIGDYVTFIITALIAFVAIPLLVINLVDTTTLGKIFIYVGIVVFFCLVYLAVFFWTQPNRKRKTLELARPDIEQIKANKKEMKRLTRSIRKDKDESGYGLEELDSEIVRNRGVYESAVAKREEQLKAFEEQMEPSVRQEVMAACAEDMNRLFAERDYLQRELDQKQIDKKNADQLIKQNYSTYIGKKNMDPERIDQLIEIIRSGRAQNILEALDVQKNDNRIANRLADAAERIVPDEVPGIEEVRESEIQDGKTAQPAMKPEQPTLELFRQDNDPAQPATEPEQPTLELFRQDSDPAQPTDNPVQLTLEEEAQEPPVYNPEAYDSEAFDPDAFDAEALDLQAQNPETAEPPVQEMEETQNPETAEPSVQIIEETQNNNSEEDI